MKNVYYAILMCAILIDCTANAKEDDQKRGKHKMYQFQLQSKIKEKFKINAGKCYFKASK